MIGLLLALAAAGIAAAAGSGAKAPVARKPVCRTRLPASVLALARDWAKARRIPYEWIVATIMIESCGDPDAAGDSGGRSVGYMQVNTVAHAAAMAREGVTRDKMFNPRVNLDWGTRVMRKALDDVQSAYAAKNQAITQQQLGQIMRVYYKGPAYVLSAIAKGLDPRTSAYSGAREAVAKWDRVLVENQAFV